MKILVTGATGFVGRALTKFLSMAGHDVTRLVRRTNQAEAKDARYWNPNKGILNPEDLEGFDAVVHLAGDNIADGRWSDAKKQRIADSRIKGTQLLCDALAGLKSKPKVLVSASAIGYYGNRGNETLSEVSLPSTDFLSEVCQKWERATRPAQAAGIRVVNLRIGVVLGKGGGPLKMMLPPFLMGVGGPLGNGNQYMSWIDLDDLLGAIHHAMINENLSGPVNAVAPNPVTNRTFSNVLNNVLGRLPLAFVPWPAVWLMFGEMGNALLLASTKVEPVRLLETGFRFQYPELKKSLKHALGKA